jgi:hypothetical protein
MCSQAGADDTLKQLKIDLGEVAFAMENATIDSRHFLDLETGDIVFVSDEIRSELNPIDEEAYADDGSEIVPFEEALKNRGLPDWMEISVREAAAVDLGFGSRFVEIPFRESRAGYEDMEDFIETVSDERLRNRLWRAIEGRGAFGRFRDKLLDHPNERDRWHTFKDERERERAIEWLRSEGVEPIEG